MGEAPPPPPDRQNFPVSGWRQRLHTVIFEADTPAGRLFDIVLLVAIVVSVAIVLLDSVASIDARWGPQLRAAEFCKFCGATLSGYEEDDEEAPLRSPDH